MMGTTAGDCKAARTATFSFSMISGGVLAGAKNMPHEPMGSKPGSMSFMSGTLGNAWNGLLPVKASARTRPSLISPITDGGVTNMTSTLPLSMPVMTSEALLHFDPGLFAKNLGSEMQAVAHAGRAIQGAVLLRVIDKF